MKLSKIKLHKLAASSLEEHEMKNVRGGQVCGCGCCHSSSNSDNSRANSKQGYYSPGCTNEWVVTPDPTTPE